MEGARAATVDDLPVVERLAVAARDELGPMRGGRIWAAREATPEPSTENLAALLVRDDARVAVGTIDDTVVGYGIVLVETLRTGERLGVITDLFVERGAREVGVGEALLDLLLGLARSRGCAGVDAIALPGHRATKNFFEGAGFTARALIMHRSLEAGE